VSRSGLKFAIAAPTDYESFPFGGTLTFLRDFLGNVGLPSSRQIHLIGLARAGGDEREDHSKLVEGCYYTFLRTGTASDLSSIPIRLKFVSSLFSKRSAIVNLDPDVVYAHSAEVAWALNRIAPSIPIVLHCHGTENAIRRSRHWYGRLPASRRAYERAILEPALSAAARVLVTADRVCFDRFVRQYLQEMPEKAIRIPAMVNTSLFRPSGARASSDNSEEPVVRMICIGRLERLKGVELPIRALRDAIDSGVRATLTVIGDGTHRRSLEHMAARLGVQRRVIFTGYLERVSIAEELRRSDVYVSGSTQEGFSIALLEALASGVPAVVTDVGGVREVVWDGITGFVCGRDPAEMAQQVILSSIRANDMRATCRSVALEYSSASWARRVLEQLALTVSRTSPN